MNKHCHKVATPPVTWGAAKIAIQDSLTKNINSFRIWFRAISDVSKIFLDNPNPDLSTETSRTQFTQDIAAKLKQPGSPQKVRYMVSDNAIQCMIKA